MKEPIYLDYQATTPTDERVVKAMEPYYNFHYANPHAVHHSFGLDANMATEKARESIAKLIGAHSSEIIFTSGATEANNLALKGISKQLLERGKTHIITSNIEHASVTNVCRYLENNGFDVTYLEVEYDGILDIKKLQNTITEKTGLVSIMAANNEIGTLQPINEIGHICRENRIIFHVDGAQAVGKIPLDVISNNIDMLSLSSHKLYGPMGIGALYIRRSARINLEPLILGGGQEKGFRSGTLPTFLAVGFGAACELCESNFNIAELANKRDLLWNLLNEKIPNIKLNGDLKKRLPNNLNVSFDDVEMGPLAESLKDKIAVSFGSACNSGRYNVSHVLKALGYDGSTSTAMRIGISVNTTEEEINKAVDIIAEAVGGLRN